MIIVHSFSLLGIIIGLGNPDIAPPNMIRKPDKSYESRVAENVPSEVDIDVLVVAKWKDKEAKPCTPIMMIKDAWQPYTTPTPSNARRFGFYLGRNRALVANSLPDREDDD